MRLINGYAVVVVVSVLAATLHLSALAQLQPGKVPPRSSPNTSSATKVPAGVDTGTPATSDSMPLGTAVPPTASADRSDVNKRSAAARAAARPTVSARRAGARSDCPPGNAAASARVGTVASGVARGPAEAMASRDNPRTQTSPGVPRALPGSGFVGSGTTAAAAAGADGCG